ncbi:MAG: hypothetical protein AAFN10_27000 [Bacteroidota bacterium]
MTRQEEMQHLLEELSQLREENTRLKAVNGLSQMPEPSELEVDPLFLKIKQQLMHLQDANIISQKSMELTQQAEQALAAMIPALEVEFHGKNNQIEQLKAANVDLENTYVSVVEKLENQLKELKKQFSEQENRLESKLEALQKQQSELEESLKESQLMNAAFKAQLESVQIKKDQTPVEANPFKSLNIFDL